MSANNIEMNIIEINATIVNDTPITEAQILSTDYTGDESAEFLCQYYNTMAYFESYLENPEDLCLPDENGEIPYINFIEMMNDLAGFKWARRTWNRMERLTAGVPPAERLTQLQKSEHPDYKDWECPKCLDYLKGENELKKHTLRNICEERHTRMFIKGKNKKLPSGRFLHIAMEANKLISRSIEYKKNIEPELEEDVIEDDNKTCQCCGKVGDEVYSLGCVCDECKYKDEEEEEQDGECYECGKEGKFIGRYGDDWLCEECN